MSTCYVTHTGITHVDVFSLDVEGAELAVLETMDWGVGVDHWVIEFGVRTTDRTRGPPSQGAAISPLS